MAAAKTIILTRPAGENEALASRLEATGYEIICRPLIELSEFDTGSAPLKRQVMNLDHYDLIIFVSKSAVRFGMPLFDQYWPAWPIKLQWLAVGEGTAAALQAWDIRAQFPMEAGSAGLLEHPALHDVQNKKIVIVRGRGGRELLATTLRSRGATVEYLEAYERTAVAWPNWAMLGNACVVVITSGEMLENFVAQTSDTGQQVRLIVPSARIAARAGELGMANVTIAAGASEQALYDAILNQCRMLDG